MKLYVWDFSKRLNETKQPSAEPDYFDVVLKENTSLDNPTFKVSANLTTIKHYSYAMFDGEYFFINDYIQINAGIVEIVCEKDPMATYKSQIGAVKCFIEYAASGMDTARSFLPDPRATMTGPPDVSYSRSASKLFNNAGTVVVTVAGNNQHQLGFTCPFGLTSAEAASLCGVLYSETILDDLKKFFSDPYAAVIEAHYVPFPLNAISTSIFLGKNNSGITGGDLSTVPARMGTAISLNIPWNTPNINRYYKTRSPYTKFVLHLPYYGELEIAPESLQSNTGGLATSLTVNYSYDMISGELIYYLSAGSNYNFQKEVHVSCGVQLPIGQTTGNVIKGATTAIVGAAAATVAIGTMVQSGGATASLLGTAAGGIGAAGAGIATAFTSDVSGGGTYGSFAANTLADHTDEGYIVLTCKTWLSSFDLSGAADAYVSSGYPLFTGGTISNYSGFIKCSNASVSIPGSNADREKINSYMNNGFYYN